MNHTTYQLALIHREQLLREAADRRLAARPASERGSRGLGLIRRARPKLRKLPLALAGQS